MNSESLFPTISVFLEECPALRESRHIVVLLILPSPNPYLEVVSDSEPGEQDLARLPRDGS